ncbi:hypothetical protein CRG98_026550 [Punica granatum]|uniref:Uncharacterized protein n=1 Tax=Punica granatum TaxID=22663 RepID=A0A2I0JAQ4_PUNGR|nr:hypothetical protein CRG98_026550 [Punica granatum]
MADVALSEWSRVGWGPDVGVELGSGPGVSFFTDSLPMQLETLAPPLQPPITGTVAPQAAPLEPDQFRQIFKIRSGGDKTELIGLRRGCSRCYGARGCRGDARVSSRMGRESSEEGDIRTRTNS